MMAERGASVFICSRTEAELRSVAAVIHDNGGKCSYATIDVTDEKQVDALVGKVVRAHRTIDILVNNAGVGVYKPLLSSSIEDWDWVINTNLKGVFLCSKAVAPIMIKQKSGYIINIASGAAKVGMENLPIYCASKFGVLGLTESIKKELGRFGVEVAYLCPSYVRTSFFESFPASFRVPSNAETAEDVALAVLKRIEGHGKLQKSLNELFGWLRRFQKS